MYGDQLGLQQLDDDIPQPGSGGCPTWPTPAGGLVGPVLRLASPISPSAATSCDLPADAAPMPTQPAGDHNIGLAGSDPRPDLFPLRQTQSVGTGFPFTFTHQPIFDDQVE